MSRCSQTTKLVNRFYVVIFLKFSLAETSEMFIGNEQREQFT